jgi:hypothetical protein
VLSGPSALRHVYATRFFDDDADESSARMTVDGDGLEGRDEVARTLLDEIKVRAICNIVVE